MNLRGFSIIFCLILLLGGCVWIGEPGVNFVAVEQVGARLRRVEAGGNRLVADAVFSRDAEGRLGLVIGKEVPVARVFVDGEEVAAGGRMLPAWRGPVSEAPDEIRSWAAVLLAWSDASLQSDGTHELHRVDYRVRLTKVGGQLEGMFVVSSANGDQFTVRFFMLGNRPDL